MPNYGITGRVLAWLAGLPVGTIVTLTSTEDAMGISRDQASSVLSQQSHRGIIHREGAGVYRVTETTVGRRSETAVAAPERPTLPGPTPAPVPARTHAVAAVAAPAPDLSLSVVRPLADGSVVYTDDTGALYKVVRIA